jgi:hypothetical protein
MLHILLLLIEHSMTDPSLDLPDTVAGYKRVPGNLWTTRVRNYRDDIASALKNRSRSSLAVRNAERAPSVKSHLDGHILDLGNRKHSALILYHVGDEDIQ